MIVRDELIQYYNEMDSLTVTLDYEDKLFTQETEYLDNTTQVAVSKVLNTLSMLYKFHPNKSITCKLYFTNIMATLMGDPVDITIYSKLISTDVAMQVCAEAYFGAMFDTLFLDVDIQNVIVSSKFNVVNLTISFYDNVVDIICGLYILNYDAIEISDIVGCSNKLVSHVLKSYL